MKRQVKTSFDPETNPTDAARACVDMLNSDITKLHNIVSAWKRQINEYPDNDALMNNIVDSSSYMQAEIDKMLEHYMKVLYTSKVN